MENRFVKKFWFEENILFYLHYRDRVAVRQIEISSKGKVLPSEDNPLDGASILADKELQDTDYVESNFILEEEFEAVWNSR